MAAVIDISHELKISCENEMLIHYKTSAGHQRK